MKKKWLALAAASFLVFSTMTAQAEEPARRSITVSGSGQVTAKSDIATLHISVQTESANSKAAVRENANTMTAVRNAVIAAGADASRSKHRTTASIRSRTTTTREEKPT